MFNRSGDAGRTVADSGNPLLQLASLFLIALAVLADYFNPIGVADGFLYVLPILIAFWGLGVRSIYLISAIDSVAIFSALAILTTGNLEGELINRTISVIFIWIITYMVINRRRLEQHITISQGEVQFLVDLLTHDINNLNAAAAGYLSLLSDDAELSEKDQRYLSRSLEAINGSARLINEVVKLQNISSKEPELKVVDVDEMLVRIKELYEQPPGREVRIIISSKDRGHLVYANEVLMEVFANLVTNAIKHSVGALTIEMIVEKSSIKGREFCKIVIEDNGPGISDDVKRTIFSRSKRGRTASGGRGLGLYIAESIVTSFKGNIKVEDRIAGDSGQGAAFIITLPSAT